MKLALLGPLVIRVPSENGIPVLCKRNPDGSNYRTGNHRHKRPHVTSFWGRWKLIFKAEVKNEAGEVIGLIDTGKTKFIAGNGPDSIYEVPADQIHDLELLDDTGFYSCNFGHYKDDEPVGEYQGDLSDTE